MIENLSSVVLKEWWWGTALSGITNFPAAVTIFFSISVVVLFFMLRHQHLHWRRMWAMEGLEMFAAAGCGAVITLAFYCLPVLIVLLIGAALLVGVSEVFSFLVVLSCRGKNESK